MAFYLILRLYLEECPCVRIVYLFLLLLLQKKVFTLYTLFVFNSQSVAT